MTAQEFSNQFDVLYNNITSNQAPGLNEYEKSVFLTKAQDEIVKNYFLPQSNLKQAGFDGNQKRQIDFSMLIASGMGARVEGLATADPRAFEFMLPPDILYIINEYIVFIENYDDQEGISYDTKAIRQVIPLSYEEYTRLMSKPYKEPVKNQAWRLMAGTGHDSGSSSPYPNIERSIVDIIITSTDKKKYIGTGGSTLGKMLYIQRYVRKPRPIILADFSNTLGEDLSIDGKNGSEEEYANSAEGHTGDVKSSWNPCELAPSLHEEILQRAVELAKVAWVATGQENTQLVLEAGKRSE